jgi:hypothetical protein
MENHRPHHIKPLIKNHFILNALAAAFQELPDCASKDIQPSG